MYLDITGQKFNKLTAIKYSHTEGSEFWVFRCDCGAERVYKKYKVISGALKTCASVWCGGRRLNVAGEKYGELLALEYSHSEGNYINFWRFKCSCGQEETLKLSDVRRGRIMHCSNPIHEHYIPKIDYTGQKFFKLTLLEFSKKGDDGRYYWKAQCDCGKIVNVLPYRIKDGGVKSCGCENHRANNKSSRWKGYGEISCTHWNQIQRHADGRGIKLEITIQEAWELFLKQNRICAITDIPLKFREKMKNSETTASLDRIDSNGDYTLDNVQWIHKDMNWLKSDYQEEELYFWSKKFVNNYERKMSAVQNKQQTLELLERKFI